MNRCISIRMSNGMSFSSRYNNFTDYEKEIFNSVANEITLSLKQLRTGINQQIIKNLINKLKENNIIKIDYVEIRDEINLLITDKIDQARLFVAFYIGKIRIIDNFILY